MDKPPPPAPPSHMPLSLEMLVGQQYLPIYLQRLLGLYVPPPEPALWIEHRTVSHLISVAVIYLSVLSICHVARVVATRAFSFYPLVTFILECLACFQCCLGSLEGSLFMAAYGPLAWVIFTFTRILIEERTFFGATSDPSCILFNKRLPLITKAALIPAMLASGYCALYSSRMLWTLSPSELHSSRVLREEAKCWTDVSVGLTLAFVIQLCYLVSCDVVSYLCHPQMRWLVSGIYNVAICVPGFPYTGMFANPLTATVFNVGCEGHSAMTHIVVYLLPPVVSQWLRIALTRHQLAASTPAQKTTKLKSQ